MIEVPAYGTVLPFTGSWENRRISRCPSRYTGTVYDDSLILGGSSNRGQFDFMRHIPVGDRISVTDMTGMRISYEVVYAGRTPDVSTGNLTRAEADLILFARNTYALDYAVVRCVRKSGM